MAAFLLKRFLQLGLIAFLVTSATFLFASWIPGDYFSNLEATPNISRETIEQLREQAGLHRSFSNQYFAWLKRSLTLDLGDSLLYGRPVLTVVRNALLNTFWLAFPAFLLGTLGGVTLGTLHSLHSRRVLGRILDVLASVLLALPTLILGLFMLLVASTSQWFPLGGMNSVFGFESGLPWLLDRLRHLVLPTLCLSIPIFATAERIQFVAVRDTLHESYLRAARGRGLSRGHVFFNHLLRPSLTPLLSTLGPIFGGVLGGSLVIEQIFSWPGLGKATYDALFNRDTPLVLGCVVGGSVLLVLGNLAADLAVWYCDPRIRASHGEETK